MAKNRYKQAKKVFPISFYRRGVVFRQIYLYLATTMIADEQLRFVIVALAYPVGWMLCSALEAIAYHRSRLFHPALKKAEA